MLSQEELEQLFVDLESDRTERKRSASDRSAIRRNICAFAYDLPDHGNPGVIFIGAENDGSCAHLTISDELEKNRNPKPKFDFQPTNVLVTVRAIV